MRMLHYFGALAALSSIGLIWTAWLGVSGHTTHLPVGLVSAILTVGVHTLVILFMIVTGRVLREAMRSRDFGAQFLEELNSFFGKKAAYPAAVFGAFSVAMAGVLGYGAPALGLSSTVHMLAGLLALVFNLWALTAEFQALRANQELLDRAAIELDAIDARLEAEGELPEEDPPMDARAYSRGALVVAISIWLPYFYWVYVVWRGDYTKVSLHPWIEACAVALIVWYLARREANSAPVEEA